MTETPEEALAVKRAVESRMGEPDSTVDVVRTILDAVPEHQAEKIEVIREIDDMLTDNVISRIKSSDDRRRIRELRPSLAVRKPFTMKDLPEEVLRQFRDAKGNLTYFTFVYPKVELVDARNTIKFQDDVGSIQTALGQYHASAQSMIFADIMRTVMRDGKVALIGTFLLSFMALWQHFRSLATAVKTMAPLVAAMIVTVVYMLVTGTKLNLYNIVAFPALIGEGMEYSIQYSNRYLEHPARGTMFPLYRMVLPLLFCAATSLVGYGGLVIATHPGLSSLGVISCVGIAMAYVFAIVLSPALWQVFPKKKGGSRSEHNAA
jgi:predicted RND superfamily exporter protein